MNRKVFTLYFLLIGFIGFSQDFYQQLGACATDLTKENVVYDSAYFSIPYPNGDVPKGIGVCTDVVIRTYRKIGIDLQKEVHEDMVQNFNAYPKTWGLKKTDANIDHRRVPNLMTFFKRQHAEKEITANPKDFLPGDIVAWNLAGSITHIGVVINQKSNDKQRYLIVHNIGQGQVAEDVLFAYTIIGHYRYKK
jgi:uncharacterized protein YijF (DUF1287 family)